VPEAEFEALVEAAEDAADRQSVRDFRAALTSGDEELLPREFANRIMNGENKIRVWREYRGMSARALASKAGLSPTYLSGIEGNAKTGSIRSLKAIADALNLSLDDLV
jgi:DNA-binding XRE family transcriptional regulator